MINFYEVYGLKIKSTISFPLPQVASCTEDVCIECKAISSVPEYHTSDNVHYFHNSENELLTQWYHIGKILIQSGKLINIDSERDCSEEIIRIPILGSVMSICLFQRGLTVLHGACVREEERGVVLLGEKGQGKSTLGAWLNKAGYPFVTDDVCALERVNGSIQIRPSFPYVKLGPEVLKMLGAEPDEYERIHPHIEKRRVPLKQFGTGSKSVGSICVLTTGDELKIEHLQGVEAIQQMLKHMMINRFPEGQPPEIMKKGFQQAVELVQNVPIYRLTRPRDLSLLPETQRLLEKTLFV